MRTPAANHIGRFDFPASPSSRSGEARDIAAEDGLVRGSGESGALLARLAQEVAALRAALDASRQRIARLEVEAAEDPVSGLLNQRALLREIEKAIEFRSRYRAETALALISVDGMGSLAEKHGQPFAQRLLRTMGDRLRGSIRSCDVAARIEPYRFGILMSNASGGELERRIESLCIALSGMDRLLKGRVSAIRLRSAWTMVEGGDIAQAALARAEGLLADMPRAVRR